MHTEPENYESPHKRVLSELQIWPLPEAMVNELSRFDAQVVESTEFHHVNGTLCRRIDPLIAEHEIGEFAPENWIPYIIWLAQKTSNTATAHALWIKWNTYLEKEFAPNPDDAMSHADVSISNMDYALSADDFGSDDEYVDYVDGMQNFQELINRTGTQVKDKYVRVHQGWKDEKLEAAQDKPEPTYLKPWKFRKKNHRSILDKLHSLKTMEQYQSHRQKMMLKYRLDKEWKAARRNLVQHTGEPMNMVEGSKKKRVQEILDSRMEALLNHRPCGSKLHFSYKQWNELFKAYTLTFWRIKVQSAKNRRHVINIAKQAKKNITKQVNGETVPDDETYQAFRPFAVEAGKALKN